MNQLSRYFQDIILKFASTYSGKLQNA